MENIQLNGSEIGTKQNNNVPPPLEFENMMNDIVVKKKRGRPKKDDTHLTKKDDEHLTKKDDKHLTKKDDSLNDNDYIDQPSETEDDELKKTKLIRKITQYKNLFPDETKGISINNLEKLSQDKLDIKLKKIQSLVESRRSQGSTRGLFLVGLSTIESCDSYLGLQLNGLTNCASKSEELLQTVDEVSIKYFDTMMQTDPILRLCIGLGHLVIAVDSANRKKNVQYKNIKTSGSSKDTTFTIPEEYSTL